MTRYLIAAIAALTVALAASGWFHLRQAKATGELTQQLTAARAEVKQVRASAKKADAAVREARQEQAKEEAAARAVARAVGAALLAEPTWASTPVPQSILEALDASAHAEPTAGPERMLDDLAAQPAPVSSPGAVPSPTAVGEDERGPAGLGPRSSARSEEVQH